MAEDLKGEVLETLTLRFTGADEDGSKLHELKAVHVAEVLQGLVELTRDFEKAGALGTDGPDGAEILVRPAKEGSFIIEVVRIVEENPELLKDAAKIAGIPSLGTIIWWATKNFRAGVKDFDYLENGNVKVSWQDGTSQEVPKPAWDELQKRKRRRKKQLHQILAPMNDTRVAELDLGTTEPSGDDEQSEPKDIVLTRSDYFAVVPTDEVEETQNIFETEAQMSAIDFDNPHRWRVKTPEQTRTATVEDEYFLSRVAKGLAIRSTDIFRLRIREDTVVKNGHRSTAWTVLVVSTHRRASSDDNAEGTPATEA